MFKYTYVRAKGMLVKIIQVSKNKQKTDFKILNFNVVVIDITFVCYYNLHVICML